MRILVISPYYPPRNATGALRVHAFARCWAAEGEQVTVLTTRKPDYQRGIDLPSPGVEVVEVEYPIRPILEGLRHTLRGGGTNGGVSANGRWRHVKSALRRAQDRTGIFGSTRMPDFTDRWVRPAVAWASTRPAWDLVFSSAGPYTAHLVALSLKRRNPGVPWVAEYRDLWVDNPLARGLFPFTVRERRLERTCMRHADLVVTVSEQMAEALAARTDVPVEVVYNGFGERELEELPAERAFPDDGRVRLVFTGTLYPSGQDVRPLFAAIAAIRRATPDAASRLEVALAGPTGAAWREVAERFGVGDLVHDRGTVCRDEARRMQRDADALLLVDFNDGVTGVLTGKLYDYIGVTAPILVIGGKAGSPIAAMVDRSGRGTHLGDDEHAITDALRDLLAGRREPESRLDHAFIKTLTRDHQAQRLHRRLVALAGQPVA